MSERHEEFIAEGEELLENLNQNLCGLQDGFSLSIPAKPDTINAIFRDMHTLKGISAVIGIDRITLLSHHLESLLDQVRMGGLPLTSSVLDVLSDGADALRRLLEKVRDAGMGESSTLVDDDAIPDLLRAIESQGSDPQPKQNSGGLAIDGIDAETFKILTDYEVHRLQENIRAGCDIFRVRAIFGIQEFDRELLSLQEALSQVAELIAILPASGVSLDSEIAFYLLAAGQEESLKNLPGVEIEKIQTAYTPTIAAPLLSKREPSGDSFEDTHVVANAPGTPSAYDPSVKGLSQTVRVDILKLDQLLNAVGEIVLTHGQLAEIAKELKDHTEYRGLVLEAQKATMELSRKLTHLREGLIDIRMVPLSHIFDRLVRVVNKIARETDKDIQVSVIGGDTRMDKAIMEEIVTPLMHLVRNAVDHGIERRDARLHAGKPAFGTITLSAEQKGNNVVIGVQDDGGGLNINQIHGEGIERGWIKPGTEIEERELLKMIFQPGFSTRDQVDKISGRGVGLDVVAKNVAQLRGLIDVTTDVGRGTKFIITLPLTLLIVKALIVAVEGRTYAMPINTIGESILLSPKDIRTVEGREMICLRGQTFPILRLKSMFMLSAKTPETAAVPGDEESEPEEHEDHVYVVIVGVAEKRIGIVVDQVLEQKEIVIKTLGEGLGKIPGVAGVTEMGTRKIILVLDIGDLIEEATSEKGMRNVQCSYH